MDTPAQGSCQCGAVQLTVNTEPLLTYACFCSSCQKRTGSAFSMGLIVPVDSLRVEGELTAWSRTSDTGQVNTRYSCAACGNIIYGVDDSGMNLAKLQAGLLEDTSAVEPEVYLFARSKQPWVALPEKARPFDTQPGDPTELLQAAQAYREADLGQLK
jgi:hypothetical protein